MRAEIEGHSTSLGKFVSPGCFGDDEIGRPPGSDVSHHRHLQVAGRTVLGKGPVLVSHSGGESQVFENPEGEFGKIGLLTHFPCAGNGDSEWFLGKEVETVRERNRSNLVVEAVNREIIDRVDGP